MSSTKEVVITATVTILVAVLGYIATYIIGLYMARRKDKLDRINAQLEHFYGPLYSLMKANQQAWNSFRQIYRKGEKAYFDQKDPPTEAEVKAWRHYMQHVFMPVNERMYEIIVSRSDLLEDKEMPKPLLDLVAHVVIYRAVLKKWEEKDYSENTSIFNYPNEAKDYIFQQFDALKGRQYEMLGGRQL